MKGTRIIVSAHPKGHFEEVVVIGTPKPGVIMDIVRPGVPSGGRWNYEPYGATAASGVQGVAADGGRSASGVCILLEDDNQGFTYNDAYVSGRRGRVYWPIAGEEFNLWIENQSGTADDFVIGDKLIVDDGTGKLLISAGSPECEPFCCLETLTDLTEDNLTWVKFTGY